MKSSMPAERPASAGLPNFERLFDQPVIILAAPRSGSTLLFETLAEAANVWTIGGESHRVIESVPALNPNSGMIDSNRLTEANAAGPIADLMRRRFARLLKDRDGREFFKTRHLAQLRFLEKTPKNALRIPFMNAVFPDAKYIFLFRDVRANLSSMMEAWRSRHWTTYPRLPGWQGPPWSLLLPPGWSALNGKTIEEICAFQWASANQVILEDLAVLPPDRWTTVSYESLVGEQEKTVERLCDFAGFNIDDRMRSHLSSPLPLSRFTQTRPSAEKWRKNETEITSVLDKLHPLELRLADFGYQRQD
jgi:hypothetical protein